VLAALLCVALALAYNAVRTGSILGSGYGRQASPAAFSTPLFVGLYGLLLSSGKGVLWFAPLTMLVPAAVPAAARRLGVLAWAIVATLAVSLVMYASFEHWAGDGSWGPRYLVPLVPLSLVLVVAAHAQEPWGGGARRWVVGTLAALGLAVTLGGVGIYFGAQMREAGDYPYPLPLEHPRFMSDSHFNPAFSPIAGHWRMLARNVREHLAGHAPRIAATGDVDARLGVSADDQARLLHAIDLWWLYLTYAGYPALPIGIVAAALALFALAALARLPGLAATEERKEPAPHAATFRFAGVGSPRPS
jgi:hypothetical protein